MKVEIVYLQSYPAASFYSAQIVSDDVVYGEYEYLNFTKRMSVDSFNRKQLHEIKAFIKHIGENGASEDLFKREDSAERLPPYWYKFLDSDGETDFGLRLYCVRVSHEIVILLNGDRKTTKAVMNCANCYPYFKFAQRFANAFYDAKYFGDIEISGHDINTEDNFILNI